MSWDILNKILCRIISFIWSRYLKICKRYIKIMKNNVFVGISSCIQISGIELDILKVIEISQYTVLYLVFLWDFSKEIRYVGSVQISHRTKYLTRYLIIYTDSDIWYEYDIPTVIQTSQYIVVYLVLLWDISKEIRYVQIFNQIYHQIYRYHDLTWNMMFQQ